MPQWYIKVGPLVEPVIAAIEKGNVTYHPESFKKIQLDWLRNLRDWNISRQIWWGIPIDGAMPENPEIAADQDTFDTWFSSAQWPVAVLEAMSEDWLDDFYPTTVMETGRDLIFFWVTRMLMMGVYLRGDVPFKHVYFHGMVLDKQGKKMSKSKGNVVSPVDLVAKYGADAVRFGLLVGSSAGSDIPMPEEKIVGGRNFANKLWNISRFVLMQLGDRNYSQLPTVSNLPAANDMISVELKEGATVNLTQADRDILAKLSAVTAETKDHLENFRFAQALQSLHEFTWHQFADIYIEEAKNQKDAEGKVDVATVSILFHVLESSLKMLHPFMPFVTESIWQRLPDRESMLIVTPWPSE
jgi:valyl-tRNA synthetase